MKGGYVYIMSNKRDGTLYIGVTSDLSRRHWPRGWKLALIHGMNPDWGDLCERLNW
ncbi:hypothetical protein CU048_05255 [Beijerinckiaceae bacterium]|nr:hypothetical protein CU048_05255 [Beijerinckiaceae bacterium]